MNKFHWFLVIFPILLERLAISGSLWCPENFIKQANRAFEQKTDRFWRYEEQSNKWVEVKLPHDLISCVDGNCTVVGSIAPENKKEDQSGGAVHAPESKTGKEGRGEEEEDSDVVLPLRKRISVTKISDSSIFITGESGSIYQRSWNGIQWVLSHHDLPVSAGYSKSVFLANQSLLALSEAGNLYQILLGESSVPVWVELTPAQNHGTSGDAEQNSGFGIKSGAASHDGMRMYFCTADGSLLELDQLAPPRWINHGRPPGANVAGIAGAVTIREEVVFTISSTGDLYEYGRSSKPSWKKHIWRGPMETASLLPSAGCSLAGMAGPHSISLFLLTKGGELVERRLHQRKWKWIVHGSPRDYRLTSITPAYQDELDEKTYSLFFATDCGSIFEYQLAKHSAKSGSTQENGIQERWVNHTHPQNAKAARGVAGIQLQIGRMVFPLDDGRLAELHLPGLGGKTRAPTAQANSRRKASHKYVWSILDAPETEGWNAEYCTQERGPSNCIKGIKDEPNEEGLRSVLRRRKGSQAQQDYLPPGASGAKYLEEYNFPKNWINFNFHLRVLHEGGSFFLVTDDGLVFECVHGENVWVWLRHEHSAAMEGAVGNYNESLFFVDVKGNLIIRERSGELSWINCTAMRKGRQVASGSPWNSMQGEAPIATPRDSLFFVSKRGRLLQFTVAMRKFEWKDCRNPPNSKIACIVDQEIFREHIVFVLGRNGRLYQYNKLTELWHEHYQSQHLVLSRLPGTAMRPSSQSLTGSLFMLSEDGRLVEYHWNALEGWNWVEHGTPDKTVTLVSAPGPCIDGSHLFLIGSDGNVHLRYVDQTMWKWKNYGFPHKGNIAMEDQREVKEANEEVWTEEEEPTGLSNNCDPKVAAIRPILFSNHAVIFELRDGRLAEMRRVEEMHWIWLHTIGTPTSLCAEDYWIAVAS